MPVRDDEQVAGVVRVKVQHGVGQCTARDDQRDPRRVASGITQNGHTAGSFGIAGWLRFAPDVGHPVRRPDAIETVRDADRTGHIDVVGRCLGRLSHLHPALDGVADLGDGVGDRHTVLLACRRGSGTTPRPAATSSSPAMSMNGTFCFCALRIFFCMRSSDASTSNRTPAARSASPTAPSRYDTCVSVIGMPTACTGANHGGNAPA